MFYLPNRVFVTQTRGGIRRMGKKVFIGSSLQAEEKAMIIQTILNELNAETTLWTDIQAFPAATVNIDYLIRAAHEHDAAVFILDKDDKITKPNKELEEYLPRDNAIAEAGMFMGVLGKESVVLCTVPGIHKASDFDGIITVPYDIHNRERIKGKLRIWLDENVKLQKQTRSNVFMTSRHETHNYYSLDDRLHITDGAYKDIRRIRLMNFASNVLINPEIAEIGHTPSNGISLPSAIKKIMIETEANVELILTDPNKYNLKDLQTKVANRRAGSSEGALYSALAALYENLSTDTIYSERRKGKVLFHYYLMKTSIPFAIFNVEFKDESCKYNHVKVDLYSAALNNEDDRRSFVIWKDIDPDNYDFFVNNFDQIKNNQQLCYAPKMSALKKWAEYWESIKP